MWGWMWRNPASRANLSTMAWILRVLNGSPGRFTAGPAKETNTHGDPPAPTMSRRSRSHAPYSISTGAATGMTRGSRDLLVAPRDGRRA